MSGPDMVQERINQFFEENRKSIEVAVLFILSIYWVYSYAASQIIPTEASIILLIALLFFSVETLHPIVRKIRDEITKPRISYRDKDEVNPHLVNVVEDKKPDKVYFLHNNATSAKAVVDKGISNNCEVFLLNKDPRYAANELQTSLGQARIREFYEENIGFDNIHIRFYQETASLKALKLGSDDIAVGWYTFDHRTEGKENPIWGGENPVLTFNREDNESDFHVVDEWVKGVYYRLWDNAITLESLYQSEECAEDGELDRLHRWVTEESDNQENVEEWIKKTSSDSFDSLDDLF